MVGLEDSNVYVLFAEVEWKFQRVSSPKLGILSGSNRVFIGEHTDIPFSIGAQIPLMPNVRFKSRQNTWPLV